MENNASNALLIAAGVLISILIISLAVYVFQSTANFAKTYEDTVDSKSLAMFNRQFEIYEGRKDLTIRDIITIANLAQKINMENNVENDLNSVYHINVKIKGVNVNNLSLKLGKIETMTEDEIVTLLTDKEASQDEQGNVRMYECTRVNISDITHRVDKIEFNRIN